MPYILTTTRSKPSVPCTTHIISLSAAVLFFFLCLYTPHQVHADSFSFLQPYDVAVVVNTANPHSKTLALYYMQKRFIPWSNLITIETVKGESCSRAEYEQTIAKPVRKALAKLKQQKQHIRCLVLMHGIPLKIRQGRINPKDRARLEELKGKKKSLAEARKQIPASKKNKAEKARITAELRSVQQEINNLSKRNTRASVDSELSLVMAGSYPLAGWLPNPLFQAYSSSKESPVRQEDMIMVSRLDGPDPATVRRIIDDSAAVEEKGLTGIAYFDARWKGPKNHKNLSGYKLYDAAIHHAAQVVRKSRRMQVVLEDTDKLFQPGKCQHAALYCGWYSLARYVDAFQWQQGAVGYHIASAECTTLRKKESQVWCKRMLEKGIAATLGPVYEPYVQAFPFPDMFFSSLIYSGSSIAEAYWYSVPFTSWQMVLIADPLYRPFMSRDLRGIR